MKTKMVLIGMLLVTFSCAYGGAVYDFDNGRVTGGPTPGISLAGQDGWVVLTPGQTVRDDLGGWYGLSGLVNSVSGDSQACRINDKYFQYGIIGDHIILEYNTRVNSDQGVTIALGSDADGNGKLESGEVAFQFGHHQTSTIGFYIRESAFGANKSSAVRAGATSVWRVVLDVNLSANAGDGAGSMFLQHLSDTSGNPIEDILTPISNMQNVNLQIKRMFDSVEAASTWNGIYTRIYNSNEDNITIRGDGVVTAHAYAPSPDPWAHYNSKYYEKLDAVLSWKTGRNPSNWTQINSGIVEHHVYMRDTDNTDPNLYLAAIVTAVGDPVQWDPSGAWELKRGLEKAKVYQWCVVEALSSGAAQVGNALKDYDPNDIASPIWTFKTEPSVPIITAQPQNQITQAGEDAVFTVVAYDPLGGTLSYEWRNPSDAVVGSNSPTLTLSAVQLADEGSYYCIITNAMGQKASNTAALTIGRMIGRWFVNGDPSDASGNGNNATLFNSPAVVPGPIADTSAIQFNGTNQYATVTINDLLNKNKAQMSMAFWLRYDGSTAAWARFINYGFYAGRMDICLNNTALQLAFRYSTVTGGTFEIASMPTGEWNHFVAVLDGTTIYLYKNGKLADSGACVFTSMIDVLNQPIVFGGRIASPGPTASSFSKVSLADVRAYNYGMDKWQSAGLYGDITGKSVCVEYPELDLNNDCIVDLYEFSVLAGEWMLDNMVSP